MNVFIYMDTSNTPNHKNGTPSPATFAGGVDGNFHEFPWVRDYFSLWEYMSMRHLLNIPYIEKMDIQKVKADQLTWYEGQC